MRPSASGGVSLSALALLCAPASLARAAHGTQSLRTVALSAEHAPGTPSGVVFASFGGVPGAGDDFPPRIDAQGHVVFHALLAGSGVTGASVHDGNGLGIWRSSASDDALVARQDAPAAGTETGVEFMGFVSALDTRAPLVAGGRAAFLGGLRGPGVDSAELTNALGIWSEGATGLRLLLRTGAPAPGLPAGHVFRLLDVPFLSAGGGFLCDALWRAPGDPPSLLVGNQEGFWSDRSGTLQAVLLAGAAAPGTAPGVVFRAATSTAVGGAFRGWDSNDALRLAVNANLGGPGVDDLDDEGIWVERAAGLTLLAREGAPAPGAGTGVRFGIGNGIDAFGEVVPLRMNATGAVLFGARLSGPGVPFMRSLWTDRSGSLELVARGTLPLSGSAAGDPAPGFGAGWTFSVLALSDLDASGALAFSGFATFQLDFATQRAGLWWDRPGALTLVAKEGDPAPDAAPGTVFAELNLFLSLASAGPLFFHATLAGPGVDASNDRAVYAVDADGRVRGLLREGARIDAAGDGALRTVESLLPGATSPAGELPLEVRFLDGSEGLFTLRLAAGGPRIRRRP